MSDAQPFDVAIVGYGPVGALLANALGLFGLRVAAFERGAEVFSLPRAVHLDYAHPAHADRRESRVVAQRRNLDPGRAGRFPGRR